ncbi:MAG: hypothetical protein EHM49_06550 [Deltaproteobacteria bacterium]|nr:MAG: hypothetical protein EHM49_06550 [Deltaproteobacteria bacterium]
MEIKFKIHYIDEGFCRIVYQYINSIGQRIYYCLQDDGTFGRRDVHAYRCTPAPWFEPERQVKVETEDFYQWERPWGEDGIGKVVREFLERKE